MRLSGKSLGIAFALIACLPGATWAADWKSSDGMVSVELPNPKKYPEVKPEPPGTASWEAKDGSLKFVVGEKPIAENARMIKGLLEQVFLHELNTTLKNAQLIESESMVRQHEGYDFFYMSGKGDGDDVTVYLTQCIVKIDKKVYFVVVGSQGKSTRLDDDAMTFINSFKALVRNTTKPAGDQTDEEKKAARMTGIIGGVAVLVLIVAGIAFVIVRVIIGQKSNDYESRRPRRRQYDDDRPRRRSEEDDEDEEEDRPRSRKRREEDDDDDRPRKRRRRDYDDDEEDRPRKRNDDRY
jgi:hypothetical protein